MNAIQGNKELEFPYQPLGPEVQNSGNKIQAVVQRSFCTNACDLLQGLAKSKILRAIVITGIAVGVLFALSTPVGWLATALGVSLLAAKFIFAGATLLAFTLLLLMQKPLEGNLEFELSATKRLLSRAMGKDNFNEIQLESVNFPEGHRLYLGALPNALSDRALIEQTIGQNGKVISINEAWERKPKGSSVPFTQDNYRDVGIDYYEVDSKDHAIVEANELDRLADEINQGLQKGNVYVHCRAGVGRSATAIAAYLMKYTDLSIEQICAGIEKSRSSATIWNKLHGLVAYNATWPVEKQKNVSDLLQQAATGLEQMEKAGKKPKLKKVLSADKIAELQSAGASPGQDAPPSHPNAELYANHFDQQ